MPQPAPVEAGEASGPGTLPCRHHAPLEHGDVFLIHWWDFRGLRRDG